MDNRTGSQNPRSSMGVAPASRRRLRRRNGDAPRSDRNKLLPTIALTCTALVTAVAVSSPQASAELAVTRPGYVIQHQISNAGVGPIARISDTELAAGAFTYDASFNSLLAVKRVPLDAGPVGPAVYTQSSYPVAGISTFAGEALATNGTHALTGQSTYPAQSGGLYAGRLFLTDLNNGTTSTLEVPGNWDLASAGGAFYATATAGTGSGVADNGYSGLYRIDQHTGQLSGMNLVLDTGAPSGAVTGDAAGNLVFSLGGNSALLAGGLNNLYRLSAASVSNAIAAGSTTGASPSAADLLITGAQISAAAAPFFDTIKPAGGSIFPGISDMVFTDDGDLILSLSGYLYDSNFQFVGTAGLGMLLDINAQNENYTGTVADLIYLNTTSGGGALAWRETDRTIWVSADNHLYGIAVPEPATLLLFLAGLCFARRSQ